jgi:hypothetical protein
MAAPQPEETGNDTAGYGNHRSRSVLLSDYKAKNDHETDSGGASYATDPR